MMKQGALLLAWWLTNAALADPAIGPPPPDVAQPRDGGSTALQGPPGMPMMSGQDIADFTKAIQKVHVDHTVTDEDLMLPITWKPKTARRDPRDARPHATRDDGHHAEVLALVDARERHRLGRRPFARVRCARSIGAVDARQALGRSRNASASRLTDRPVPVAGSHRGGSTVAAANPGEPR
jgi:hypothetical protein